MSAECIPPPCPPLFLVSPPCTYYAPGCVMSMPGCFSAFVCEILLLRPRHCSSLICANSVALASSPSAAHHSPSISPCTPSCSPLTLHSPWIDRHPLGECQEARDQVQNTHLTPYRDQGWAKDRRFCRVRCQGSVHSQEGSAVVQRCL